MDRKDQQTLPETSNPAQTARVHLPKGSSGSDHLDGNTDGKANIRLSKSSRKTEKLEELAKAWLRDPENKSLKQEIYAEVKDGIDQDPFLAYEGETEAFYQIHNYADEVLIIPKERAVPEPFPVERPEAIRKAYRFLLWAAFGLILSGLGSIIFAPIAGRFAVQAARGGPRPQDRARALVILALAAVIFLAGLGLSYLFWLHIVG